MFDVYLSKRAQRILLICVNLFIFFGIILATSSHPATKSYVNSLGLSSFKGSSDANKASEANGVSDANGAADANKATEPYQHENATFVTLCRENDLDSALGAVRSWEDRFNHKFHYNWVFLNNEGFSKEFQTAIKNLASGEVQFGIVPAPMWDVPDFIDQEKAKTAREKMKAEGVMYGDNVPYRQMCRFFSGFFMDHELVKPYKYFWRVDPDTALYCDVDYDVFKFMRENNKAYGFVISFREFKATVETLWKSVRKFFNAHPDYIHPNSGMRFVQYGDDHDDYNMCHFWTNFEIGDMDFFRSKQYRDYFNSLDRDGGFFYERWGDAPVHSIAVAAMMDRLTVHYFEDVGYKHTSFQHTPDNYADRGLKCHQRANNNVDWQGISCLREANSAFSLGLKTP